MATLRGSKESLLYSIAETLKVALSGSGNYAQLKENVESVVKIVEAKAKTKGSYALSSDEKPLLHKTDVSRSANDMKKIKCAKCYGAGVYSGVHPNTVCDKCSGKGYIYVDKKSQS